MAVLNLLNNLSIILLVYIITIGYYTINGLTIAKCTKYFPKRIELTTNSGKLLGRCSHVSINDHELNRGQNVYSWLNVPYAEPPVGPNRFEKPVPIAPWTQEMNATKWPNTCMQDLDLSLFNLKPEEQFLGYKMWLPNSKHTKLSEDCLKLNIWMRQDVYSSLSKPEKGSLQAPIVVFFHGGSGTSVLDIYEPSTFVAITGVIFISVQFRVGVLGNFYLNDAFPGNQGLLDQNLALKWIHSNAELFGGDPSRITLMGSSNGAIDIAQHMIYEESWPYFKSVILQGPPLGKPVITIDKTEANGRASQLLQDLCGSDVNTLPDLIKCAKEKDAHTILKETSMFTTKIMKSSSSLSTETAFPRVVDGMILKESFEDAFKNDNYKSVPVLTGLAANEGSMFVAYAGLMGNAISELKKQRVINFETLVETLRNQIVYFPSYPTKAEKWLYDSVLYEYTKLTTNADPESSLIKSNYFLALSRIIGDYFFVCPTLKFADSYARKNKNVYFYLYNHRISSTPWPSWYGVVHADELAMVFGQPLSNRTYGTAISSNPWLSPRSGYTHDEKLLSDEIISYYNNFIRHDDPNIHNDDQRMHKIHWPSFRSMNNKTRANVSTIEYLYMMFKTDGTKVTRNNALEECSFWNEFLPSLIEQHKKEKEAVIQDTVARVQVKSCPEPTPLPPSNIVELNSAQYTKYNLISILFTFLLFSFIFS